MDIPSLTLTYVQSFTTAAVAAAASSRLKVGAQPPTATATLTCHCVIASQQTLIVGTSAGDLLVWRTQKLPSVLAQAGGGPALQARALSGHQGRVQALISSDSGGNVDPDAPDYVFSAGADRTVRIWAPWQAAAPGTEAAAAIQTLVGHTGTVTCLAWTGIVLVTGSTDRTLRVWRAAQGPGQRILRHPVLVCSQTLGPFAEWITAVTAVAGADSPAVYAADGCGQVHVFGLGGSGTVLRRRRTEAIHERAISDVLVVPAERLLVTLAFDGTLQVHETDSGAGLFAVANPNRCRYTGVAWDAAHNELVAVDAAGYVQVWSVFAERCRKVERLRRSPLHGVALVGDAVVVGAPECIEVWRMTRIARGGHDHAAHQGAVLGLVRGPERLLWSASVDNTVRAWTPALACVATLREADASEISAFGHVPDTNLLVTGLDSGQLHVWNADTGSALTLRGAHTNSVTALAVVRARRRDLLVTGGYDGRVLVWDVTRRRTTLQPTLDHELVRHAGAREVLCVGHHPESGTLLAGGNDAVVQLWDLETYESRGLLVGHRDAVTALASDGNLILSGADDGDVRLWDGVNRQCLDVLRVGADTAAVRCLAVAQPGGVIVVAHADAQIRLWDYVRGVVTAVWCIPHGAEPRALFVEDSLVLIGAENGTITTFSIPAADSDSGTGCDDVPESQADLGHRLPLEDDGRLALDNTTVSAGMEPVA